MAEPRLKGKHWSKDFEKPIYEKWKKDKVYAFDKKSKKKIYSIDTPPPYVNTPVHIGQATTYVLMDFFARFRRMIGQNVLFPLGLDRNGLPIEMAAEKKFNVKLSDLSREEVINKCQEVLKDSSFASVESFLQLGISFNSWEDKGEISDLYHTDSPAYRALTQGTFIDLWNKGYVYEAEYLTNYCPGCQTTIADSEIDRKNKETFLNYTKFKIKGSDEYIIIATTRPELLCTAAIIIYNPKDNRYSHLKGKTAITPIFNIEVPIIEHTDADPNFGSGIAFMSKSAGDQDAVRFLRKMDIKPESAVGIDGKMLPVSGLLEGLYSNQARKKIIEEIKNQGLMEKQEVLNHSVPICERSKHEIEFVSMKEFYLKQVQFKSKMNELAKKISFHSPKSRQILLDWIDSVSIDWPISRRRYYATEIPLWRCEKCEEPILPSKGKYYRPWKEDPPIKNCPKCKSTKFVGETRVFDTWFDSSISPLYILGYERHPDFFEKNPVCSVRPQGKEIVRTWLYYTILKDYLLTGKLIFEDAWINYHIVDNKGHKMSKSKGNAIDPQEVLAKFGAEPFRLWSAVEGNLDRTDFRCSLDRIEGAGKTLTKLWNVARFISMFPEPKGKCELSDVDKWIIQEVNSLIKLARKQYEVYDFHNPAVNIKHFIWETFASHYLELVKSRAYNQNKDFSKEKQNGALFTLNYCLDTILKLLAPIVPFVTHTIYNDLRGKDVHSESFPTVEHDYKVSFSTIDIVNLNSAIWKYKKDKNVSLRDELKEVTIPTNLKSLESDLKAMHNIENVKCGKNVKIS